MMKVSSRLAAIQGSVTLAIDAKAKAMKAAGIDVIGFGAGEPDFNTPAHICQAAKDALDQGKTRYTPAAGEPALRKAICSKLLRDNDLSYTPDQIVVNNGAKHSLFNAFQALLEPGDEVLVPSPYWVSYPELIKMAGGIPVAVMGDPENGFKTTALQFRNAITPKTRAIVLNSPNNPNGYVYTRGELEQIAQLLEDFDLYCVSDEIYEFLVYEGAEHISIASISPQAKERTIVINGMSKAYAMTGWRIGYTASPTNVAKAMTAFQSHSTSNVNSIAQYAAIAALSGPDLELRSMVAEFAKRRECVYKLIEETPGLSCIKPMGAFYVMMNVSSLFGKGIDGRVIDGSTAFTELLLEHAKVAVVPGIGFGADAFVRLSYAVSMETLQEGFRRIRSFVDRLA